MADMDPLSTYEYPYNYENLHPNQYNMYNVKLEPLQPPSLNGSMVQPLMGMYPIEYENNQKTLTEPAQMMEPNNILNQNNIEEMDTKANIKLIKPKRRSKAKGKTSNYWNKKVVDKNFPFYGCTICNVSFTTIGELDKHVTIHKGRLTSYDIRLRNQLKRKQKLKQLRRQKKLGKAGKKVKKEEVKDEIYIKPEEGYIGNEIATDFNQENQSVNNENVAHLNKEASQSNTEDKNQIDTAKDDKKDKATSLPYKEPEDPRLQKLFKCFACQKQFSLSYYLKLHVRSHTDEKPYTCAECGQSFITASKLGRHTKRIHLAVRFQCRICYRHFSRFDILTRHFDKVHKDDKIEGEPYDYNAILPYIKELEEQLKQKEIEQKTMCETKIEDDWFTQDDDTVDTKESVLGDKPFIKEDSEPEIELPLESVIVEEVKLSDDETIDIKLEKLDEEEAEIKEESARDDSISDEDYFPTNTWAATPDIESSPTPALPPPKLVKSSDFPTKCDICEKVIKSQSYYRVHLRTHSGEKPFKCHLCNKGFITSSKMHRHVLTHEEWEREGGDKRKKKEKEIKKETEKKGKDTKNDPEIDADNEQGTKKKKTRNKRGSGPSPKKKKDGSPRKSHQRRPHACAFCNKRFLHLETLEVHKKCHEGEALILKCSFCLDVMPNEEHLKIHEASHTGPRPYLCTICGRTYIKKETMIYHRKTHCSESSGEKRAEYICDICSKTFNAQCKLQRHLVSHRVDKFILKYECPVCAHMFNTKYHIQMHLTTHQKEGLILEENRNEILAMVLQNARKIPKKGDAIGNLTDLIPSDERSRVCNICGQDFQHFYYLEEHLKSHGSKIAIEDEEKAEEKKHICPVCKKGFKLHYYLKLHSFTHTKIKPFICQQCGKGFITKGKLKRHLETHSGLKKFQCHICYKFFTRPSYLRIHVRTIHGTQDYNFSIDKAFLSVDRS